jgi:hypothetical protein
MEFLKLAAVGVLVAGIVGTSLGFLIKFIVDRGEASATNDQALPVGSVRKRRRDVTVSLPSSPA